MAGQGGAAHLDAAQHAAAGWGVFDPPDQMPQAAADGTHAEGPPYVVDDPVWARLSPVVHGPPTAGLHAVRNDEFSLGDRSAYRNLQSQNTLNIIAWMAEDVARAPSWRLRMMQTEQLRRPERAKNLHLRCARRFFSYSSIQALQ